MRAPARARRRGGSAPPAHPLAARLMVVLVTLGLMGLVACGGGDDGGGSTSASNLPTSVGRSEGQLNLIAWEGYTAAAVGQAVREATGCQVNAKYAGSSDEMVTLMRQGGGSQYDMVSASGDASLRLIRGGDVKPVNVALVPGWKRLHPAAEVTSAQHGGRQALRVSLQWGPNTLLYNTRSVTPAPTSWSTIYDPKYKGKVTVPDNPIQIADAALYLSRTRPELGIRDPYELTEDAIQRGGDLLRSQRPLIKKYWALASDEIDLFKNGDAVVGASWPYQTITLQDSGAPVQGPDPERGRDRLGRHVDAVGERQAPELRLRWMQWISTPRVQAAAGDLVRRDAGQHEGLPVHGQNPEGRVREVPRQRTGLATSTRSASGRRRPKTAGRQPGLHGLHDLAAEVDGDEGLGTGL